LIPARGTDARVFDKLRGTLQQLAPRREHAFHNTRRTGIGVPGRRRFHDNRGG